MSRNVVRLSMLLPLLSFMAFRPPPPHAPAKLRLSIALLHAAALTAPRAATDSTDGPYFLFSILGPRSKSETVHLPATGHLTIHADEAVYPTDVVDLSLEPGDTVRLLVSVLEGKKVLTPVEVAAAAASTKALSLPATLRTSTISTALEPVTKEGAHWLGSATLLLTNEAGTIYWRALECVATCNVQSGGGATAFPSSNAPVAGVVELIGSGGTYHMKMQANRAP
jgi:hypothetical protein